MSSDVINELLRSTLKLQVALQVRPSPDGGRHNMSVSMGGQRATFNAFNVTSVRKAVASVVLAHDAARKSKNALRGATERFTTGNGSKEDLEVLMQHFQISGS